MSVEVIQLPKGGILIKTDSGNVQVGAPPETIKDTIKILGDVPDTFVIPNKMFFAERGISMADIEFPVYFNYFVKRKAMKVIGSKRQLDTVLKVVSEALLGPKEINLTREYPYWIPKDQIPNLRSEMEYLRPVSLSGNRRAELSDMINAIAWGPDNRVPFNGIALERTKSTLRVVDGRNVLAEVPLDIEPKEYSFSGIKPVKAFEPPVFGITVIGSGSGFDTDELTCGFILWVNKRGILVDPPVDSTYWIKSMEINPSLIDSCILTHAHDDHDSGLLQKLIEEKRINLFTTETVMESFVYKYATLTDLSTEAFKKIFNFHPVSIHTPIKINNGEFRFFYTFHSIPTIGFEVYFQGKSFVHSADTLYDPKIFKKLYEIGEINKHRMTELINFPWHHTVIFHEAGIPPLHTPMQSLIDLPEDVKKRIYLVHLSGKKIPEGVGLKKAPDGKEESIVIPASTPPSNEALMYLDVLNHIDLFSELPISKAREFLTMVNVEHFKAGEKIVKDGDLSHKLYMIVSGQAKAEYKDGTIRNHSSNDYFGEISLMLDTPRSGTVTAITDVEVLTMDKYDFMYFIRGSEIALHMEVIASNREAGTAELFKETFGFNSLTMAQQTQLQSILVRCKAKKGEVIAEQGNVCTSFFLVDKGEFVLFMGDKDLANIGRGAFVAKINAESQRGIYRFTVKATENSVYYKVEANDFYEFLEKNPGVFLLMRNAKLRDLLMVEQPVEQDEE